MTTRRRLLLFVLLAGLTVLGGVWLFWPRTAITRENAAKIRVGMTLVEVETILGGSPRNETTGPLVLDIVDPAEAGWESALPKQWIEFMFVEPPIKRLMWQSDQVVIWVTCNGAGCVNACDYFPMRHADESPIDMLRRWLRL